MLFSGNGLVLLLLQAALELAMSGPDWLMELEQWFKSITDSRSSQKLNRQELGPGSLENYLRGMNTKARSYKCGDEKISHQITPNLYFYRIDDGGCVEYQRYEVLS